MDSEYSVVPLGEVAAVRSGYAFKSSDMGDIGYPLVKIGNIEPPRVEIEGCDRIPEAVVKRTPNSERYILKAGDILIAMTGATAGKVGRFPVVDDTCYLNQRVGKVYPSDLEAVSNEYLYQVLARESFSQEILSLADGSAQGNVSGKLIETYEIPLPPLGVQRSIAHLLGTLDDKIELNRKTNETLEGIAKALFKSWFVDFDPVKAKAEDRPTGLPDEISELFPDSFEESELGEIPSGWKASTLGEENKIVMGQSPPGHTYNEEGIGLPFYQGRSDFGFRHPGERVYCSEPSRLAEAGSTLMSVRAPVGSINMASKTCCTGRGVASIRSEQGNHAYTYYLMDSIQNLFDTYNSEGTVFGAINKKDLSAIEVVQPSSDLEGAFERFASQVDRRISLSLVETESLTALRDALLPRLISGELRVPDAEKMLEEVGV